MPLTVQLLVLELCCTLPARLLVLLAMGLLAVHATVFHEAAGRAVLELDPVAPELAAVGARLVAIIRNRNAAHRKSGMTSLRSEALRSTPKTVVVGRGRDIPPRVADAGRAARLLSRRTNRRS